MKIKLLKAKHFWKNGESAEWLKSEKFNHKLFEEFKSKYESVKYSKEKYIKVNGRTLLLFYQSKQDIFGRPITEITALQIDKKVKNIDMLHASVQEKIRNIFDDTLEYTIEVESSQIDGDNKFLYYGLIFGLVVLLAYGLYAYTSNSIQENVESSTVNKNQSSQWKWNTFCNNNKYERVTFCYQEFIKHKCKKREKFSYTYIEFIRKGGYNNSYCNHLKVKDRESKITDIMSHDEDMEANINKKFFTEEKIKNGKR